MVCPVYAEPADLDADELARALERHWGMRDPSLEYRPVGFGSHHWLATDADGGSWFVSADDLASTSHHGGGDADFVFAVLDRAFRTAAALRDDAGLEFVHAPLPSGDGTVLRRLDRRYAIRMDPFVDGASGRFGPYGTPEERREMCAVLGRLHAASDVVPGDLPVRDDLGLPSRAALEGALRDLDAAWGTGPFGEPVRDLLRSHAGEVEDRLRAYDELAERVRGLAQPWVVTHGEPHTANVIRDRRGAPHLVDWDTTRIAPRERDLRMVLDDNRTGWDEYTAHAGPVVLRPEAMELYRAWWDLAEICVYVAEFRRRHEDTRDTRASWENLGGYLSRR
jgi:spectinomycin phosphotransferase